MGSFTRSGWTRILGLAACLGVVSAGAALAAMSHEQHGTPTQDVAVATPVSMPAGPMLQDRMSKAIEQVERQVQTNGPFKGASAHAMQQGVLLVADDPDKVQVSQGMRCPANAPVRKYDVTALNVEITVNRFGDFYPGYMFALTENVAGVREEEAKNKAARESEDETFAAGALSNGLQGDLIQPLVIRANQGDCLRITLKNEIAEEATNMIINGSQMVVAATGKRRRRTIPMRRFRPARRASSSGTSRSTFKRAVVRSIAMRRAISTPWVCWDRWSSSPAARSS